MGAAIERLRGRRARCEVAALRFVPVKTTNDLLVLRSDAYVIGDGPRRRSSRPSATASPPFVDLDADYYKLVGDFDARFPAARRRWWAARRCTSWAT